MGKTSFRNSVVLVLVAPDDRLIKASGTKNSDYAPYSVFILTKNGGALPSLALTDTYDSMEESAVQALRDNLSIDVLPEIDPNGLKPLRTYKSSLDGSVEITTAYLAKVDNMLPLGIEGIWLSLGAADVQPLEGNHNKIIADANRVLLDKPTISTGLHFRPGVCTDVVLFGYRNIGKGKAELSVLLTRREYKEAGHGTGIGNHRWALPGTYVSPADGRPTMAETARHALRTKTGITSELRFHQTRNFVNPKRMFGSNEDGTPTISLPYFAIVKYEDVNPDPNKDTTRTSGCQWFPIVRFLYGKSGELLADNYAAYDQSTGKKFSDVIDFKGDYVKRKLGDPGLLSPEEECGLPAADVYIENGNRLRLDYHQESSYYTKEDYDYPNPNSNVGPVQDWPKSETGEEILFADHGNIILAALQSLRELSRFELSHFETDIKDLLPNGFLPADLKQLWESIHFPFKFSRSNLQKKFKRFIVKKDEDKATKKPGRNADLYIVKGHDGSSPSDDSLSEI